MIWNWTLDMIITIFLGNIILAGIVLLAGFLYPSIKDWSYLAASLIGLFLILELIVEKLRLLDAAKISAWTVNALSTLISIALLLPYKLGWADWWAILVAIVTGGALVVTAIIIVVFRPDGVADLKPETARPGQNSVK